MPENFGVFDNRLTRSSEADLAPQIGDHVPLGPVVEMLIHPPLLNAPENVHSSNTIPT